VLSDEVDFDIWLSYEVDFDIWLLDEVVFDIWWFSLKKTGSTPITYRDWGRTFLVFLLLYEQQQDHTQGIYVDSVNP